MKAYLRHIALLVTILLWVCNGIAQTIGDFKMDETELYAMTKQMGQFMRRFNYEEDQFGNQLNPKDPMANRPSCNAISLKMSPRATPLL